MIKQGVSGGGGGGGGIDGPTMRVYLNANLGGITGGPTTVAWQFVQWDTDGAYSAGVYTVATAGVYWLAASVWDFGGSGPQADAVITHNATVVARGNQPTTTGITDTFLVSTHLSLAVGDTVEIQMDVHSGTVTPRGSTNGEWSYWSLARVGSTP